MEIEEALTTYLMAQTGLTALIGRRFFYDDAPETTKLPYVVVMNVSNPISGTHDGQSTLESPYYQFTVYADTKLSAKAVGRQLRAALCDYRGDMAGLNIQHITMVNDLSAKYANADGTVKADTLYQEYKIDFDYE